ncbi:MAG: hypothetical protein WCH34_04495 [Bacteroidota bacterium]
MNKLIFVDKLNILKLLHKEYPKSFIDLIYINLSFNSKRNNNFLFEARESLLKGNSIQVPFSTKTTFKVAPKEINVSNQGKLDF